MKHITPGNCILDAEPNDDPGAGGLLGSYAKTTKRVQWADIEAAKDEEFARTQAGFTLKGAAPLSRKRIRSPPPAERQEQA